MSKKQPPFTGRDVPRNTLGLDLVEVEEWGLGRAVQTLTDSQRRWT